MPNILADENIVFADSAFSHLGKVTLLPGRKICKEVLNNTEILIVRSITKVDMQLLNNTPVKFVGTSTTGTDHIDLEYLEKNNIAFAWAEGCNAYSVAEYVLAALVNLSVKLNFRLNGRTIGIVGFGNIGSKVANFAKALGMKILINDPPLKRTGDKKDYAELDEILGSDIITLHVPLNMNGMDKTYHLLNQENLNKIRDGAILINTSRGAVINNRDLAEVIDRKKLKVVLDVWEDEPDINMNLLGKAILGTPHIAGYSLEGKVNGTEIIYNQLCNFLGAPSEFIFRTPPPEDYIKTFNESNGFQNELDKLISNIYSIQRDNARMREALNMNPPARIKHFDLQRKEYPSRRELNNYSIQPNSVTEETKSTLRQLRFRIAGSGEQDGIKSNN